MSSRGLATQRTPRLDEPRILGLAVPNTMGTKGNVSGMNAQLLDIWARGTYTTRIYDYRQLLAQQLSKRRPMRNDVINQHGGQGKSRRTYLDDS